MLRLESNLSTFAIAAAVALLIGSAAGVWPQGLSSSPKALAAETQEITPQWAASATGRIEPKDGELRISAETAALIVDVPVKTNDKVQTADLLVQLDDEDLQAKWLSAKAEAEVREREREEEPATKGLDLDRRKGQDDVARAAREVFTARQDLDKVLAVFRAGHNKMDDVNGARQRLVTARNQLTDARQSLVSIESNPELQLMGRLETALQQARADLTMIESAIERTRVRAPGDGTVLNVFAKAGELAAPSPDAPLLTFGDISGLRVRAELEEREVVKVRVGQEAVIKVDAYPGQEFPGTVTSIAASLGSPNIVARGPRRPNDVDVLEVFVTLDGQPPLLAGMRVDVFFKADAQQESAVSGGATQ